MTNRQDSLQIMIEHKQQKHVRALADCVALVEAANAHRLEAWSWG